MTPNPSPGPAQGDDVDHAGPAKPKAAPERDPRDTEIIWYNIWLIGIFHLAAVYFFIAVVPFIQLKTFTWSVFFAALNAFGVTAGAHRYWTHRSYKAKLPLRIILMLCYSIAGMNPIFDWVRDHRTHHKFSDTDGDPHNINRGFFFSHCGWLMRRKHPEVYRLGKLVDMSDILNDPVAEFQRRYHSQLKWVMCFILPTIVPPLCWNETWYYSFAPNFVRYVIGLNTTWSVNSFAHMYGAKPFDKKIAPSENLYVSIFTFGEGWHNYHHVFPWDYKTSELSYFNFSKALLDMFARIGWAYDLKTAPPSLIRRVVERYGDGSHPHWHAPEVPEAAADNPRLLDDLLDARPASCEDNCQDQPVL